MSTQLLKARLALELPAINASLNDLIRKLPAPVQPAAVHTVQAGGKRLRPMLTILAARLFGSQDKAIFPLAATLEMLHAATLMHDDVIDNAATRRGTPAAHTIFGTTESILAGDALLSGANACVAEYGSPELCRVFAQATYETAAGEVQELHAMHNVNLKAEEYAEIIRGKTACLIRSACEMGAIFAHAPASMVEALRTFGENIGMAFQMVDDALDCAPEEVTGKPTGGDILEGKLTPPVQLYRLSLNDEQLAAFDQAFTTGHISSEHAKDICQEIRNKGFDNRTREMADTYLDAARIALLGLPDRKERNILSQMSEYVRNRKK